MQTMQAWFHANEAGKIFGANFSPDPNYPQQTATMLASRGQTWSSTRTDSPTETPRRRTRAAGHGGPQ
jgi:hypothetical protein